MTENLLKELQNQTVTFLQSQEGLKGISVEAKRSCDQANALCPGSASILALWVLEPIPLKVLPHAPGPQYECISLRVRIVENILLNFMGKDAVTVGERVVHYLHLWRPEIPGWDGTVTLAENNPWRFTAQPTGDSFSILEIEFHASTTLGAGA